MSAEVVLMSSAQLGALRAVADVLVAGSSVSPSPSEVPGFDDLLRRAVTALGVDTTDLDAALTALPATPSWEDLRAFAASRPTAFERVSSVVVGAYFLSPEVLVSLGRPTGGRRPADREQVVDELGDGLLEPVLERGCPIRTLDDVNG